MTTDRKTNYDAETNNLDVQKIRNRRKRCKCSDDETNNVQLNKEDSQRSNLNIKHLSVTLC